MSMRSLIEFNHDITPTETDRDLLDWAKALRRYLVTGRTDELLPLGVKLHGIRHHTEDRWHSLNVNSSFKLLDGSGVEKEHQRLQKVKSLNEPN